MPKSSVIVTVSALLAFGPFGPCHAAEPTVSFQVKKGWVSFALQQNGKPVPAVVQVLDEHGRTFAEGETGQEDRGEFPLPAGSTFTIEIKVGSRTADPICLRRAEGGTSVEPGNVLLSFGLRPCCRVSGRGGPTAGKDVPPASPRSVPAWLYALFGMSLLLIGSAVLVRNRVVNPSEPGDPRPAHE